MYTYKLNLLHPEMETDQTPMTIEIETEKDWYGHSYLYLVGRIDSDGTTKSILKVDADNENTDILDRLVATGKLIKKRRYKRDGVYSDLYYIPYVPENHSSTKPTVVDQTLDLRVSNIKRDYTYEILLVEDEGYKRYLTITSLSKGAYGLSLFEHMSHLEYPFEDWCYAGINGFRYDEEDDNKTIYVDFYDDFGEENTLEFETMDELLDCVHSVRIVEVNVEIMK